MDDHFWAVSDPALGRVMLLDPRDGRGAGAHRRASTRRAPRSSTPAGVAVHRSGPDAKDARVFIADPEQHAVFVVGADGGAIDRWGEAEAVEARRRFRQPPGRGRLAQRRGLRRRYAQQPRRAPRPGRGPCSTLVGEAGDAPGELRYPIAVGSGPTWPARARESTPSSATNHASRPSIPMARWWGIGRAPHGPKTRSAARCGRPSRWPPMRSNSTSWRAMAASTSGWPSTDHPRPRSALGGIPHRGLLRGAPAPAPATSGCRAVSGSPPPAPSPWPTLATAGCSSFFAPRRRHRPGRSPGPPPRARARRPPPGVAPTATHTVAPPEPTVALTATATVTGSRGATGTSTPTPPDPPPSATSEPPSPTTAPTVLPTWTPIPPATSTVSPSEPPPPSATPTAGTPQADTQPTAGHPVAPSSCPCC